VRVISQSPETPFYPHYDNRTQRLIVLPSLAVRLPAGVALGLGFNYLAGLAGRVAAAEGATRAIEARVDESIFSVIAFNAGLRWQATRSYALALVYRQQFAVPFRTISRNRVAGQPIDLDIDAEGLFTPHQLVLGSSLKLPFRVTGSLDLEWSHWSAWRGPYVTVSSELPLVGRIDAVPPRVQFNDTVTVRGGLEWKAIEKRYSSLTLRGGYAFQSMAAPVDQPGVTNLLDGHKHRLAAGGGLRFELFGGHVRADIHGALDIVQSHTLRKKVAPAGEKPDPATALADEKDDVPGVQISNPGYPDISGGGVLWALGFTITVETR
jgi:long-subunit fatty acid transport protein